MVGEDEAQPGGTAPVPEQPTAGGLAPRFQGVHEDSTTLGQLDAVDYYLVEGDLEPEPDLRRGAILGGRYRLDHPLGRGASGRVFRATELKMGRAVAIKVLRCDLRPAARRMYEGRFIREASRTGSLQHPNVVTIHDFDSQPDGTCYIVMEHVGGTSLGEILLDGPLEPDRVLRLFEQVVRGLRAAHRAGLVHRDVKPGNILVAPGEDGEEAVKLVDFGLVRDYVDAEVTDEGRFLGTPNYAAPEQVRQAGIDPRSDLYSVGVVMYRCLTGALPYASTGAIQMLQAHLYEPYPPMESHLGSGTIPLEVEEIVQRCMEKDADRRYQCAEDLLRDIRRVRAQVFGDAVSVSGGGSASTLGTEVGALVGATRRPAAPLGGTRLVLLACSAVLVGVVVAWGQRAAAPSAPLPEARADVQTARLAQEVAPETEEAPLLPVRTVHRAERVAQETRPAEGGFLFTPTFGVDVEATDVWGALPAD